MVFSELNRIEGLMCLMWPFFLVYFVVMWAMGTGSASFLFDLP